MCFGSTLSYPHKEFLNPRPPRTKYNPLPSGDSRMKKVGGYCGAKEKIGGGNINICLAS